MLEGISTYIDNTNEILDLLEKSDKEYSECADLIAALRQRSDRVFHLLCTNNDIIKNNVQPLLEETVSLTQEQCAQLDEAAHALCTYGNTIDACLALHVRKKLLSHAEKENDTDEIIHQCYECGIASFLMYGEFAGFEQLKVRQYVVPWFQRASSYLPQLASLSPASRGYVLRSLNNRALVFNSREFGYLDEFMSIIHHTLSAYQSPDVRALMPDLNWTAFERAVHHQCLYITDSIEHGHGTQYLPDVKKAAACMRELKKAGKLKSISDQYSLMELKNVLHQLPDEGVIDQLDALYAKRNATGFENQDISANLLPPAYTFVYEERIRPRNLARVNLKIAQSISYINAYHHATGLHSIGECALVMLVNYPHIEGVYPFRDALINIFQAVHVPTYVHSNMVSTLSQLIGSVVLDSAPEYFIGFLHIRTAEEAVARKAEILEFIRYAGLLHDVGKFFCLSVITQYARRLFDDEFDIIKAHSVCGYELMRDHVSTAPYAEIALMHHITYDRKGGYAMDFVPEKEQAAIVTDIIHIADAMDAATDSVGRCYTQCKALPQLMEELTTRTTCYHPQLVRIISSLHIQQQLETILSEKRIEIYKQAYDGRA